MVRLVQTGGKLYIAGEYSILTPGQTAIIAHIPIFMTASIQPNPDFHIQSDMFDYAVGMEEDKNYRLIQEAVRTFSLFYGEKLTPFKLEITGKLEKDGIKFGIGSSGSVTLLTIKALASYFKVSLSPDQLFKLASYTLLKLGDNGSMGDLACIAYEDMVSYTAFDREKIAELIKKRPLADIMSMDWGYEIERLTPKITGHFLVGWTRQAAISRDLINQVKSAIDGDYLDKTQEAVLACRQALLSNDNNFLKDSLQEVSDLLVSLSPAIYSQKLKSLKEAEAGLDAIAKSSGAGGGDCGIAFVFSDEDRKQLVERWEKAGIELLYEERYLWQN